MSKIYGVTVGTPINPARLEREMKPVKTVNGKTPDENGNVEIGGGNGGGAGTPGTPGKDGKDGLTPYIKDGYWWIGEENTNVKAEGKDGKDGKDGEDGYTPIKGVDYFDGQPGTPGRDGYTPVKGVDYFDGRDGAPGATGATGAAGYTPVKGVDYFTAADKAAIVQDVLAALPYYDGEVDISGGVSLISFTIAGTSYQAESGMTWEQWCNSNYNTYGYSTTNASYVDKNIEGRVAYICKSASGGFNNCVLGNGVIDANGVYYHYIHSSGSGN